MRASTILATLFLYAGAARANLIEVLDYEIIRHGETDDRDIIRRHKLGFQRHRRKHQHIAK